MASPFQLHMNLFGYEFSVQKHYCPTCTPEMYDENEGDEGVRITDRTIECMRCHEVIYAGSELPPEDAQLLVSTHTCTAIA